MIDARTRKQLTEGVSTRRHAARSVAFTSDGSQLVVVESAPEGAPARITIRDAATLQPIGSPIEPDGFTGSFISQ